MHHSVNKSYYGCFLWLGSIYEHRLCQRGLIRTE